jgi:lipid II:glycine glycyltransferase (peptidoglycan interpeptide bridge formation enzyme)
MEPVLFSDFRQSLPYQSLLRQGGCKIAQLGDNQVGFMTRLLFVPFMNRMIVQRTYDPDVLAAIDQIARQKRVIVVKIAPQVELGSEAALAWEQALAEHRYTWDKNAICPTRTRLIDLNLDEQILLDQMESKTRYNVRLAGRRGVKTEFVDGERMLADRAVFDEFFGVYQQNSVRLGMHAPPPRFLERLCEHFKKDCFFALSRLASGETGAVATFLVAGDTVSYQMNGSTEAGRHDFAPTAIIWAAFLEGKRRGCRWFDFDGEADDRYQEDEEWKGFTKFKSGFGGRDVLFLGSYTKSLAFMR